MQIAAPIIGIRAKSFTKETAPKFNILNTVSFSGERGIRTPGTVIPYGSLANCWFKPLTHLTRILT